MWSAINHLIYYAVLDAKRKIQHVIHYNLFCQTVKCDFICHCHHAVRMTQVDEVLPTITVYPKHLVWFLSKCSAVTLLLIFFFLILNRYLPNFIKGYQKLKEGL